MHHGLRNLGLALLVLLLLRMVYASGSATRASNTSYARVQESVATMELPFNVRILHHRERTRRMQRTAVMSPTRMAAQRQYRRRYIADERSYDSRPFSPPRAISAVQPPELTNSPRRGNYGTLEPYEVGYEIDAKIFNKQYASEMQRLNISLSKFSNKKVPQLCLFARGRLAETDVIAGAKKAGLRLAVVQKLPKVMDIMFTPQNVAQWEQTLLSNRCDIAVFWGWDLGIHHACKNLGKHYLLMETPYYAPRIPDVQRNYSFEVQPNGFISLGFDGLQGRSVQWKAAHSAVWWGSSFQPFDLVEPGHISSSRFQVLNLWWLHKFSKERGLQIKPWRQEEATQHVLLLGQWDSDRSLISVKRRFGGKMNGVNLYYEWAMNEIRRWDKGNRQIFFKAHPVYFKQSLQGFMDLNGKRQRPTTYFLPKGVDRDVSGMSLEEALQGCYCVVTMSSNSAVHAILQGVPVIATDPGAMVWPVATWSIREINAPQMPDRAQWLADLAYAQWTRKEVADGSALQQMLFLGSYVTPSGTYRSLELRRASTEE
ncbi:hypothetical protein CYMTET_36978 [Cymbomonas tetramitiformis]|uniref:Capsule polysaccharide biosynthesis protein n=1 Tax=Cymbomonas tetramitiformis TaxID=36881 RepID=A0AAE0CEY3_9CHLO|nr:hypothetical protein CYMTET_36978 [Cymbomonas tetramitiformis]